MLLRDLEKDIINPSESLSNILMKAKILGSRLKNQELQIWAEREINGYENINDVPAYRKFRADIYGNFSGPFGSGIDNARIPFTLFSKEDQKLFNNEHYMLESVGALERLINHKNSPDTLTAPFNGDQIVYLNHRLKEKGIYDGMECLGAWKLFPASQVVEILTNVRNRLLSIVLELQEKFPDEMMTDDDLGKIPIKEASVVINNNIYGSKIGHLTSGYNVTVKEVIENDFQSLTELLKQLNVSDSDISELKNAIEKDNEGGVVSKIGSHCKKWLSKIYEKSMDGLLGVGSARIIPIIQEAIEKYFGI